MTSIRIDVHAEAAIRNGKVAIFVKLPSWMMEEGCLQKGLQPEGVIKVKLFKSEAAQLGRGQRLPEQPKYRNTRLLVSTVEALKKLGRKDETYDDIIKRLLETQK